jgi:putative transposase
MKERGAEGAQKQTFGGGDHRRTAAARCRPEGGRCAREAGVSTYTIYAWKAKYGGMDVSQAQEARQLREENAQLKKLVADLSLNKDALQSVIRKTVWSAARLQPKDSMIERSAQMYPASEWAKCPGHNEASARSCPR